MANSFSLRTTFRLAWRHARRRPLQSLFFVVGVAIGVAMIIAIDLANGAAARAFDLGTETVTGRATHQITGGPSGLDEALYASIRRDAGYRLSAPVVESYVLAEELDAQPMQLLGIDPFAEAPFRSYLGTGGAGAGTADYLATMLVRPNSILLSTVVAERYGLALGDEIQVRVGPGAEALEIVGLLEPSDDLSRRALDGLLITDIATAQELLGRVGKLDRIDLIIADDAAGATALAGIAALMPPSARVDEAAARAGTVNEMTEAFRLNLTALSLLALVVGVFLIYNTVTFSVIQRRPVLGSLRALGMTRREIFMIILLEAGVLGLIGALLGIALGVVLGRGAVQLVTQTVNDLFFVVAVREVQIPAWTLVKGGVIGLLAALIGAAAPALEATSVAPAGALKRSNVEERTRRLLPWITALAVGMLVLGAALLIPEWHLVVTFGGLFAVVIGCALLTPVITLGLMTGLQRLLGARAGVIERMAPRGITRALSRTSVAMAALMVAVSVIIGVGIMISSFRNTVEIWLDDVLQADIYISPAELVSNQLLSSLTPELAAQLDAYPEIVQSATVRSIDGTALLDGEEGAPTPILVNAFSDDIVGADRRFKESVGDWQATWGALEAGGVFINEPMANRLDLGVGDELLIQTDTGLDSFPIVGVAVDFDVNNVISIYDPDLPLILG